jgi:hypothetical protein
VPRYFFPPRKDADMRVPNEVLKCVVFIGREHGAAVKYIGAGFFVVLEEKEGADAFRFPYLVTANHVADAIDGGPFKIRGNNKSGEAIEIAANEDGNVKWFRHSQGKSIDVAVCQFGLPTAEFDALALNTNMFATRELAQKRVGVGDEVLVTGLFSKIKGNSKNIPIVRVGNLAMAPYEPVVPTKLGNIEAYVIEVRSLDGISGSPVFIRQTGDLKGAHKWGTSEPAILQTYTDVIYLLGLAHGHWNLDPADLNNPDFPHRDEGINIGLAIVIPAAHILEVIHNEELTEMRKQAKDDLAQKDQGATMDSAIATSFTKEDFEHALKKASRKIEPPKGKKV